MSYLSNKIYKDKRIICICIYFLLYAGYIKILFPQIGAFFTLLQFVAALVCGMIVLSNLSGNSRIVLRKSCVAPMVYIGITFIILFISSFRTGNSQKWNDIYSLMITLIYMVIIFMASSLISCDYFVNNLIGIIIKLNFILIFLYISINITNIYGLIYSGLRGGDNDSNPIWIARLCGDIIIFMFIKYYGEFRINISIRLALLFVVSFLMGSKGPLIATFIAILILYLKKGNIGKKIIILIITSILVSLLFLIISNSNNSFVQDRFSVYSMINPAPGYRLSRYLYTIKHIPEKWFAGHGLSTWSINYWNSVNYIPSWVTSSMIYTDYPHNLFLEMLYTGGIISCIPTGLAIVYIKKMEKAVSTISESYMGVLIVLFANLIYAMFSGSIAEGNRGIYYFVAIYCGVCNQNIFRRK